MGSVSLSPRKNSIYPRLCLFSWTNFQIHFFSMTWTLQQMNVVGTFFTLKINFPGHHCPKQCSVFVGNALRCWDAIPGPRAHLLLPAQSLVCRMAHSRPPEWWGWQWSDWLPGPGVSSPPPAAGSSGYAQLAGGNGTQLGQKMTSVGRKREETQSEAVS